MTSLNTATNGPSAPALAVSPAWRRAVVAAALLGCGVAAAIESSMILLTVTLAFAVTALLVELVLISRQRNAALDRCVILEHAASQLHEDAHTDPLTRLPNRLGFRDRVEAVLQSGGVGEAAFLFADLDRFKEVNDSLGHDVGDLLLGQVADRLKAKLQPGDQLARMGGDEFAAVIAGDGAHARVEDVAAAMVNAVNEPFLVRDSLVSVGVSIGIALAEPEMAAEEVMRRSDIAMYRAKSGRTGYSVFDNAMDAMATSRSMLRADLINAIANNDLRLALQPIVEASTGKIAVVEALLRWTHPVHGEIIPLDLVSMAEEGGQIMALGEWVIDEALRLVSDLDGIPVAINVSPMQFSHHGFATMISDKLIRSGIAPELVEIEITESVLISHQAMAKAAIRQLREIGIKVVLDDFGSGYSSLSYLQSFDFDKLKIDRTFLRDIGTQQRAAKVLRNIVELGHSLDMRVVAEGVENEWQCRLLQLLRCDYFQGYYFSPPVARDKIDELRTLLPQRMESLPETKLPPRAVA